MWMCCPVNHHLAPVEARWPHLGPPPRCHGDIPDTCLSHSYPDISARFTVSGQRQDSVQKGREKSQCWGHQVPQTQTHVLQKAETWAPLRAHLAHPIRQGPVPPPLPSTTVMTTTVAAAFTEHLLYTRHSAKTEYRIDAFELLCWRRLLRVPWTFRRSNQSILKEISPE